MGKGITFCKKDEKLVEKIENFQNKNNLEHFVDAVRKLCEIGLEFDSTVSKLK